MSRDPGPPLRMTQIIDVLEACAEEDGKLTIDEVLNAFGARVYGPLLLAPALIGIAPIIGALPGVSITVAMLVTLGSLQLVLGLEKPWLPGFLRRVSFPGPATVKALRAIEPAARRIEVVFRPRLVFLARQPWIRVTGLVAFGLGLLACVGSLAPGLIVAPLLAVIVLALGLAADDGFVLLIAYALTAASGWFMYRFGLPLLENVWNWAMGLF